MTADTITAIKKALEGVTQDEAIGFINTAMRNWIHVPKLDADDLLDLAEELQRFSERRYASTLESLQRENERMKTRLDIGPQGEDAIDVAESAADFLRHRAETAEAEVKRLRDSQDGLCSWLLHRFGPNTPEGREASWRMSTSAALSSTGDTHGN